MDKRIKSAEQVKPLHDKMMDLLESGLKESRIEAVQQFMAENFEDEYGQNRVEHVMEKLSGFEGLSAWFSERQIARLALLDVVDPSYSESDPDRPNTHFEDVIQMAKFVDENFDWLAEQRVGLRADKNELIYAIINSDIGKAGTGSSTAIAKFFNLKNEALAAKKKGITLKGDAVATVGEIMKISGLESDEENWRAIAEYLNLKPDTPKEELAKLDKAEIYQKHEQKINVLSQALKENPEFSADAEERVLLMQLAAVHHVDREWKIAKSLDKKGYLNDAIMMDILDKIQASLFREPRKSLKETYNFIKKIAGNIPTEGNKIWKEYLIILDRLFEVDGVQVPESNHISRELERLKKAR